MAIFFLIGALVCIMLAFKSNVKEPEFIISKKGRVIAILCAVLFLAGATNGFLW